MLFISKMARLGKEKNTITGRKSRVRSNILVPHPSPHDCSVFRILSGWISYCPPKAHVQIRSVPQQSIHRNFHIPRTSFLSLSIDYCTLTRVIQVNKVFISLLAMETQGLPHTSCSRSKIKCQLLFTVKNTITNAMLG